MLTLGIRKIVVIGLIGLLLLTGNILLVANWLQAKGVVSWAGEFKEEYLTGTALTIIVVLLILLTSPRSKGSVLGYRCPVCNHRIIARKNYCPDCGSKLSTVT